MIPEEMLWNAVLDQAYRDAVKGHGQEAKLAQMWLRGDTKEYRLDLSLVCDFAGVPVDRVISWAQGQWTGK